MSKILLINPPLYISEYCSRGSAHTASVLPPLGLAYIAATLIQHGHKCEILDGVATQISIADIVKKAKDFDVIGITSISTYVVRVIEIIRALRDAKVIAPIIVGGPHATILPESLLRNGADFAVIGEGEFSTLELINKLSAGDNVECVTGIAYLDISGNLIKTPKREIIADLDTVPLPARDLLPMHLYKNSGARSRKQPSLSLFTSRGCPGVCTFCNKTIFGTKVRYFSVDRIIEEFFLLRDKYKAKDVAIWDDNFVSNHEIVHQVCDRLIKHKFKTSWSAEARIDMVDEDLLKHMKAAGCDFIAYGIESGSQRVLDSLNKKISLDMIKDKIRITQKLNIPIRGYFMMGVVNETLEDMQKTIDFAIDLNIDVASFTLFVPLPGTVEFNRAKKAKSFDPDFFYKKVYPEFNFPDCAIYVPDNVSEKALLEIHKNAYNAYYFRPKFILKNILSIRNASDIIRYFNGGLNIIKNALHGS